MLNVMIVKLAMFYVLNWGKICRLLVFGIILMFEVGVLYGLFIFIFLCFIEVRYFLLWLLVEKSIVGLYLLGEVVLVCLWYKVMYG